MHIIKSRAIYTEVDHMTGSRDHDITNKLQ